MAAAGPIGLLLHPGQGAGGEEFPHGEADLAEDLAGILVPVLVPAGALPGGHAVVVHGDEQLGVPLQPDHGELPQGHIQPPAAPVKGQVAVEAGADAGGDLRQVVLRAAPAGGRGRRTGIAGSPGRGAGGRAGEVAGVDELQAQDDGIHRLHHRLGEVAPPHALAVPRLGPEAGGEDLGVALAAKEEHPLVKDRQPADLRRAGATHKGLGGDAVVVADVHAVKAPVITGGLHVDVSLQQFRPASPHAQGPVDHRLGGPGGVHPQVLDAVFVGRYGALYNHQYGLSVSSRTKSVGFVFFSLV